MQGNPFAPREAAEERPSISGRTGEGGLNQVIPFPGENVCPETSHHLFLGMPAVIRSEPMLRLLKLVERVARSNAAVLITGESGTGKELIARAIHHYSMRCSRAWVDLNCAALPELLLESELFGYEKGAFSGAAATKPGLLELANTGSVFLDEIGELPPRMQVKLLRVLDGAPYYRLGGTRKISVDSRVIAATNADLEKALKEEAFAGTYITGWRKSRSGFHRCASGPRTSLLSPVFFWSRRLRSSASPKLRFAPSNGTTGRVTCANCAIW